MNQANPSSPGARHLQQRSGAADLQWLRPERTADGRHQHLLQREQGPADCLEGARYSLTSSVDLAAAYYHHGRTTSPARRVRDQPIASGKRAGSMDASFLIDWQFAPKWDTCIHEAQRRHWRRLRGQQQLGDHGGRAIRRVTLQAYPATPPLSLRKRGESVQASSVRFCRSELQLAHEGRRLIFEQSAR
jgi:hypothetical protein